MRRHSCLGDTRLKPFGIEFRLLSTVVAVVAAYGIEHFLDVFQPPSACSVRKPVDQQIGPAEED